MALFDLLHSANAVEKHAFDQGGVPADV